MSLTLFFLVQMLFFFMQTKFQGDCFTISRKCKVEVSSAFATFFFKKTVCLKQNYMLGLVRSSGFMMGHWVIDLWLAMCETWARFVSIKISSWQLSFDVCHQGGVELSSNFQQFKHSLFTSNKTSNFASKFEVMFEVEVKFAQNMFSSNVTYSNELNFELFNPALE